MFKILTSVFLPPLGVYLHSGLGKRLYLNIFLTCMGIIPGVVHAIWGLSVDKQGFRLDRLMLKS